MDNHAKKYVQRAPRYLLRSGDRKTMRFSLQHMVGPSAIEETVLLNLSETGAAFLVPKGQMFHIGDVIKVEIPVPSGDQIAWFGRIVRIEEYEPRTWNFSGDPFKEERKYMIALRFEDLPAPHSRALRKGIEASIMQAMRDQQFRTLQYYKLSFIKNIFKITAYLVLTVLAIAFIYYFSQPSKNYDSKRGAPWGERFKF